MSASRARVSTGIVLLIVGVLLAAVLHLGIGATWLSPLEVLGALLGSGSERSSSIVLDIRLPRTAGCIAVGAILGVVGAAFQAMFRNPLAEPYVVGVSSGAGVGGVLALVFGLDALLRDTPLDGLAVMALAFVTGLASTFLVYALARSRGQVDVRTLLLAGVVVASFLAAVTTFILFAAGYDTNRVLQWLSGSTTPMFWPRVAIMSVACLVGTAILTRQAKALNAMAVSEQSAQRLGVDIGRLKVVVMVAGAAMTAAAVGSVGVIPFLGLVAPHIARRVLGVDWRVSMIGSLLVGSLLLLIADVAAQRIVPGLEMPVGVVTAMIGAPFLLALLRVREA